MCKPPELTVSGGFLLLIGWFALCSGWRMTLLVLASAALHEWGHWAVLRLFHARVRTIRLSALGAVMEFGGSLRYGQELAAVLAGPAANLLAALLLGRLSQRTAAGANAALCLFNLLPVYPLDGGRALFLLLCWLAEPSAAEWGSRCVGAAAAAAAGFGTAWLVWRSGGSLWLLPAAGGMLAAGMACLRGKNRRKRGKRNAFACYFTES